MDKLFEYGCFMCGKEKTTDLKSSCPACGHPFDVSHELLKRTFGNYTPSKELGRGYYGTVLLAENRIGTPFALKLCSSALYQAGQKDFIDEVQNYRKLGNHANIARLIDAGQEQCSLFGTPTQLYYLVTEYVENAKPLEQFIQEDRFNVEDMIGITVQVCAAVARAEACQLWHNDLHGRNILLAPRTPDDLDHHPASGQFSVKVVDFGSAIFRHPGPEKRWQDIQWIGKHLYSFLEKIKHRAADLSKSDRWFLKQVPVLIDEATDVNPSKQLHSARDLGDRVDLLWKRSSRHPVWQPVQLQSAFAYPNANEFPDDSYIAALFSDNFPWLPRILTAESSLLLTGPRGCGKTMILRAIRLRSLIAQQRKDEPSSKRRARVERAKAVGFFVSARLALSLDRTLGETPKWLETPQLSNAFLVLAFLQEIIDSFLYAAEEDLGLLSRQEADELCSITAGFLGKYAQAPLPTTVAHFSALEHLSRSLERTVTDLIDDHIPAGSVPRELQSPRALVETRDFLTKRTKLFRAKRVVFLLDDFTQPLVPERCQRAFLPIMFGMPQFIVSAHSKSVTLEDLNGVRYDPSREFTEINLGTEYVKTLEGHRGAGKRRCEVFLDDIFTKRFARDQSGFFKDKTLRNLLGDSKYASGSVAEEIASLHKKRKLRGLKFHGLDSLLDLCTGDLSYIIDLVGAIFRRHETKRESTSAVAPAAQNTVMRMVARREIMKLLDIRIHDGRKLFDIARTFGIMSRKKILLHAADPESSKKDHVPQYLRIEIEQNLSLPEEDDEMLRALLQYGIFVDGGWGSSQSGTTTQVLLFRKLFCPAFPTTITSRDSFSWTAAKLSRFLRNPMAVGFEEGRKAGQTGALSLFGDMDDDLDLLDSDDFERA
jgi:hypothetical protein